MIANARSVPRSALMAFTMVLGLLGSSLAHALDLISEEEAQLPAMSAKRATRGITRAPSIKMVSPPAEGQIKAPFAMKIDFQPHGGATIDASTVKLTYLRKPTVDLTPRIKAYITVAGISVANVNVPAGTHDIRIDVADSDGRTKSEIVSFTVAK